jgi:hypothetical protein
MAGIAALWRALEDGVDVTGFTGQVTVRAVQFKAGGLMIETQW